MATPKSTKKHISSTTINGRQWFYYMNTNEKDGQAIEGLLTNNAPRGDEICICWEMAFKNYWGDVDVTSYARAIDTGEVYSTRGYSKFSNVYEYCNFIKKLERYVITKSFYEIIFGDRRSRMYFDIDFEFTDGTTANRNANIMNAATLCISWALKDYGFPVEEQKINNWMLFTSNRDITVVNDVVKPGKISLHIVLPFCMSSNVHRLEFAAHVNRHAARIKYENLVDMAVYGPKQAFRILGCHKAKNMGNYPKTFVPTWKFGKDRRVINTELIDWDPESNMKYDRHLMATSMVNWVYSSDLRTIEPKNYVIRKIYDSVEYSEELINSVIAMVSRVEPSFQYTDTTDQGVIKFKRGCPSYCSLCKRSHEHENKFVSIFNNTVYLQCPRANAEHDIGPDPLRPKAKPKQKIGVLIIK